MSDFNPFPNDPDRREIWEILMRRDFEAFLLGDWQRTVQDFWEEEFQGLDADKTGSPDHWILRYPDLASYRDEWLRQADSFKKLDLIGSSKLEFLFQACGLHHIQIVGNRAVAHKKFDGKTETTQGTPLQLVWQTLYFLKKIEGSWKITGFVGYLPNPLIDLYGSTV